MSQSEGLQYNDAESIETVEDITLPRFAHHLKIRSELNKLADQGFISYDEADELFEEWREDRQ